MKEQLATLLPDVLPAVLKELVPHNGSEALLAVSQRCARLEGTTGETARAVPQVKEDVSKLQGDMAALRQLMTDHQQEVGGVRCQLQVVKATLTSLQGLQHNMDSQLAEYFNRVTNLQSRLTKELQEMASQVTDDELKSQEQVRVCKRDLDSHLHNKLEDQSSELRGVIDKKIGDHSQQLLDQIRQLTQRVTAMYETLGDMLQANGQEMQQRLAGLQQEMGTNPLPDTPRGTAPAPSQPAAGPSTSRAAAPQEAIFTCPMCTRRFQHQDSIENHMERVHFGQEVPGDLPLEDAHKVGDMFSCFMCTQRFHRQDSLEAHLLMDHPEVVNDDQVAPTQGLGQAGVNPPRQPTTVGTAADRAGPNTLLARLRYGPDNRELMVRIPRTATVHQLIESTKGATGIVPPLFTGPGVAIFPTRDAEKVLSTFFSKAYMRSGEIQLNMALPPGNTEDTGSS